MSEMTRVAFVGSNSGLKGRVSNLTWSGNEPVLLNRETTCSQQVVVVEASEAERVGCKTHWVGELRAEYLADRCV